MAHSSEEIKKELARLAPLHKQLKEEVIFILESGLKEADIKFHSIGGRLKSVDSILNKLERKQLKGLPEINDLVGVRIVCLFLSDIKEIGAVIRKKFEVLDEDNKIEGKDTESFGYMSFHFIVKLKKTYSGPRYDAILDLPAEIQVRTIAMDAWAATSHYLDYKSEADVPRELRKDFFALSGLFYVADQHFEMFYRSRLESKKAIASEMKHSLVGADIELNLDTLQEYLKRRLPERERGDAKDVSALLADLKSAGYTTIDGVEEIVRRASKAVLKYESEDPACRKPDGTRTKFSDVGVMRTGLRMLNEEYDERLMKYPGSMVAYKHLLDK